MKPDIPPQIHAGNVRHYLARFMDGETSNAEEAALYAYFRSHKIEVEADPELASYRDMLAYLETGMADDALPKLRHTRLWKYVATVAAACIVVVAGLYGWRRQQAWQRFAATYEGSYMIIDGKTISDLRELRPALLAALRESEQVEQETLESLRRQQEAEHLLLEELLKNTEEPTIRQLILNTQKIQVTIP